MGSSESDGWVVAEVVLGGVPAAVDRGTTTAASARRRDGSGCRGH